VKKKKRKCFALERRENIKNKKSKKTMREKKSEEANQRQIL